MLKHVNLYVVLQCVCFAYIVQHALCKFVVNCLDTLYMLFGTRLVLNIDVKYIILLIISGECATSIYTYYFHYIFKV